LRVCSGLIVWGLCNESVTKTNCRKTGKPEYPSLPFASGISTRSPASSFPPNHAIPALSDFYATISTNMISSITLSRTDFVRRFPPGGKPNRPLSKLPTGIAASKERKKDDTLMELPNHVILNDVPDVATSCVVYDYKELQEHAGDSTYPVPPAEGFAALRPLKSCEAVFKQVTIDKCVFLHMYLSPEDGLELLGQECRDVLMSVQRDVNPFLSVADRRSLAMDRTNSLSRNTLV